MVYVILLLLIASVDFVFTIVNQTDNEKAAMLNPFFSSVFTKKDLNNFPHINSHQYTEPLSNLSITTEQVYRKLRSVKSFKPPGPDGFHPKILKEAAEQLSVPLCLIFSDERFLPSDWRVANVIPIFKKGERSQPGNYRPISLTSAVCKVFESVIRDSIVRHMSLNALFAKEQHGFLSTDITQLLIATEYWTKVLLQGDSVDVVYFDFKN